MDRYQSNYKRIVLARKLSLIPLLAAVLLYFLSIYMNAHYDVWIIRHIRQFSFAVLFITISGFIYLYLFTRNLKVNFDYCRIDSTAFDTNVKYASFGIVIMALMLLVSLSWIITLFVQVF